MKIHIQASSSKKPHIGDRKTVKGIEYVRELAYVTDFKGRRLGLDCTGGKQRYVWVKASI